MKRQWWPLWAVVTLVAVFMALLVATPVADFEQVRASTLSSEAILLDRHGIPLQRLRLDHQRRMLDWVSLDQVSPVLQQAILIAEDQRFYYHLGVDPLAIVSAGLDNFRRPHARGASTITMQLAKLLDEDAPIKKAARNSWRIKLQQMWLAFAIELHWSKREILEAYLNRVSFRGELVGVDAAARGLLAKGPSGLDQADAAVLAALVRAPGASRMAIARRACATLKSMNDAVQAGASSCEETALLASMLPDRALPIPGLDDAPHLARRLLTKPGQQLQVALDAGLQRFAQDVLRTHLAELATQNVEDGAVVVLDNLRGEVLAYVGSSGDFSGAAEVDGTKALRQPGSTLKPFLYAVALDQGWLNASSVLDDSPLALTTPSGLYIPQDYDRHFRGAVSVRTALGSSLNVPAVRTLTLVGIDQFLNALRRIGLTSLDQDAEHYGFGLALGAGESNLLQLTNAYRTLANGGQWTPINFLSNNAAMQEAEQSQAIRVLSEQASFIISDILADPAARATTFGLSSPLSTNGWAAVKTGTSKGMRDNWAIGYTDRYTVGVWVGNFSGAPMWDVSGITGAAPVWRDVVGYLHRAQTSKPPAVPEGVVQQAVNYRPAIEPPRKDWVIARAGGEQQELQVLQVTPASSRLIAPPDSAIIAPDPDIPPSRQALLLQSGGIGQACMKLNGKAVASCGKTKVMVPLPLPGRHTLELTNPAGKVLDKHQFEVRALNLPKK